MASQAASIRITQPIPERLCTLCCCRHRPGKRDGDTGTLELNADDLAIAAGLRWGGGRRLRDVVIGNHRWSRQRHEGRPLRLNLFACQALLAQPAMHHVRMHAMTQGHAAH